MTTMEDLTKTQIVLLTLLISFVTSIATGIITTSLLAQAPIGITQTINRVVERTIETVAPAIASEPAKEVKEVIVVKEEDAILTSIEKVTNSIVRIKVKGGDGIEVFYGLGAIVSKEGLVVADGEKLVLDAAYTVTLNDGKVLPLTLASKLSEDGIVLFKIEGGETLKVFSPITFSTGTARLGQSVVAIEGKEETAIAVGRVTSIGTQSGAEGVKTTVSISTDISSRGELSGSPLINLSGELLGIKATEPDLTLVAGLYVPREAIQKLLAQGIR